ncbi:hypothetical protein JX266_007400 [Neoarthrinium moseri]|nr:hypothetical protein JX266_007400 [Neoarthrinium moseri]
MSSTTNADATTKKTFPKEVVTETEDFIQDILEILDEVAVPVESQFEAYRAIGHIVFVFAKKATALVGVDTTDWFDENGVNQSRAYRDSFEKKGVSEDAMDDVCHFETSFRELWEEVSAETQDALFDLWHEFWYKLREIDTEAMARG